LSERKVLITGASRGIGAACAEKFASCGFSVAINYERSDEKANEVLKKCVSLGSPSVLLAKANVSSSEQIDALYGEVSSLCPIDTLVINAGVASYSLFQDVSEEEYDRVMDTNVKGAFLTIRKFLPDMIANKRGNIIIISSMWGQTGGSCEVVYSASKAALIGMTKALAKEVGPSGIRVNCVAPGVVETDMVTSLGKETLSALAEDTPLCRNASAEDIANAVYYLASDESSFITGHVLGVNGGLLI
jgi:3-oxoacyl-[acyl-carrier protein] reductase